MRATSRAPLALKIGGVAHRTHPRRRQKERAPPRDSPSRYSSPPDAHATARGGAGPKSVPTPPVRAPAQPRCPWAMGMPSAARVRRSDPPSRPPGPPRAATSHGANGRNGATPTPPRRKGCSTVARGDVGIAQGGWGRSTVHQSAPFWWPAPAPRGRGEDDQSLIEDCYRSSAKKSKRSNLIVGKTISNDQIQGFSRTPKTELRSLLQRFRDIFSLLGRGGPAICGGHAALAAAPRRPHVGTGSNWRPRPSSPPSA